MARISYAENIRRIEEIRELRASLAETTTKLSQVLDERAQWRGRAERLLGENHELRTEIDRLRADNVRLSQSIVDIALKPPPAPPEPLDITSILDQFRRAVQPDVIVHNGSDAPDQQRAGINWTDQGLDNTGGTPETTRGPFDDEPISIPDYVLDVESLTPNDVKGTRGGWYNPKPT